MKEIKSVRVRSSNPTENDSYGSGDFKVTISEDGLFNKRIVNSIHMAINYNKSELTDDELIQNYISTISKLNKINYEIIQDPWLESVPKLRKFGFYPYYLNNHSSIYIEWNTNGTTMGGSKYSDKDGLELSYSELQAKNIESAKNKTFFIVGDDKKMFTIGKNNDFISGSDSKVFDGVSTKDSDIIDLIISKWNLTIPDYKVALCDDNGNESCTIIEYKSPIDTLEPVKEDVSPNTENILNPQKLKINIQGLVDGLTIKAKQDIPSFKVIIGDLPIDKNISYDEYDNLDDLDNEYIEGDFQGEEENWIPELDDISDSIVVDLSSSIKTSPGGGGGIKRFQTKKIINGVTVYNGELPSNLVVKLDFNKIKLEKHAAKQLNDMNKEFKAKFGVDIPISGGTRTFDIQNSIFDWELYEKIGKGRKKGTNGGVAAAKPGTSQHGWGLAIDTSGLGDKGSAKFDFLEKIGPKYNWINPEWAKGGGAGHEPWHREYIGKDAFKNDFVA